MAANSVSARRFRASILALIHERELTIQEVADQLGMSRPGLSRVLHGHEDVTFGRAEKIAGYFGLELCDVLRPQRKSKIPA